MGRCPILAGCLLLGLAAGSLAAESGAPPPKKDATPETERLQVWADRIVYNADTGKFVFTGQVLVINDILGLNREFHPRFVRQYADLNTVIEHAVRQYVEDVRQTNFPSPDESY